MKKPRFREIKKLPHDYTAHMWWRQFTISDLCEPKPMFLFIILYNCFSNVPDDRDNLRHLFKNTDS